jgi:hypothetical protein
MPVMDAAMPRRALPNPIFALAAFATLAAALVSRSAGAAEFYVGSAYARGGTALLYTEEHYLDGAGTAQRQLVLYRCPDGTAFARKMLSDSPASTSPDFDFVDGRSGYREGVATDGSGRRVYAQRDRDTPIESRPLALGDGAVIDAGFDTYVRDHWDALSGRASRIPFVLPSRFGTIDLRLGDANDVVDNGVAIRRFRMRLASWYGFAAPSIELSYSIANRRLQRFVGIGTIRDRDGRNQDVRIEFPAPPRPIAAATVDAAAAAPLNGRCDG